MTFLLLTLFELELFALLYSNVIQIQMAWSLDFCARLRYVLFYWYFNDGLLYPFSGIWIFLSGSWFFFCFNCACLMFRGEARSEFSTFPLTYIQFSLQLQILNFPFELFSASQQSFQRAPPPFFLAFILLEMSLFTESFLMALSQLYLLHAVGCGSTGVTPSFVSSSGGWLPLQPVRSLSRFDLSLFCSLLRQNFRNFRSLLRFFFCFPFLFI